MTAYLGDFAAGATVHFTWDTSGANGASITRATNGTVSVYKNNGTTQSTTGVTDTEDFDSLTGVHACTIDLSSDGTFYAAGANFSVVLSAATIDGQTVNATLAHFSIENRTGLSATARANLATAFATTFAEASGVPAANAALWTKLNYMFAFFRNKITQTATTQLLRNDADSGTIATSTVSDDNTTYTRGEFS